MHRSASPERTKEDASANAGARRVSAGLRPALSDSGDAAGRPPVGGGGRQAARREWSHVGEGNDGWYAPQDTASEAKVALRDQLLVRGFACAVHRLARTRAGSGRRPASRASRSQPATRGALERRARPRHSERAQPARNTPSHRRARVRHGLMVGRFRPLWPPQHQSRTLFRSHVRAPRERDAIRSRRHGVGHRGERRGDRRLRRHRLHSADRSRRYLALGALLRRLRTRPVASPGH